MIQWLLFSVKIRIKKTSLADRVFCLYVLSFYMKMYSSAWGIVTRSLNEIIEKGHLDIPLWKLYLFKDGTVSDILTEVL